jgi:hypothetical protein
VVRANTQFRERTGRGRLFFDAMHGSTVKGARNDEPQPRTASDIAAMGKLGFAAKSSFSASKNKCSPSPAFHHPTIEDRLKIND